MEQYRVTGMSCAACAARVEKAVNGVEGVTECSVSLLTNSMGVEGSAKPEDIIKAVEAAGYGAALKNAGESDTDGNTQNNYEDELRDTETPKLRRRLLVSLGLLVILMYLSMGHMMLGFKIPAILENAPVAIGAVQMVLAAAIMIINRRFFINGGKGLVHGAPNMDTLVALGSGASFLYSTVMLAKMYGVVMQGDVGLAKTFLSELYYESAAMILTLITVGKMLEARSKGKTTDALKSLMRLAPQTAIIVEDGRETEVPVSRVRCGDVFVVRPGGTIPVDGVILEGTTAVNEAALTGESMPVDKTVDDMVSAATINTSGHIRCEAIRVGSDTTLAQIIKMVSDAAATKAPIAKIADKVSGVFVPIVIGIAAATFIIWMICGESLGFALARGISVLVISCPCALGLATPVAIMVGTGMGAKNGILFKTAASLEATGKVGIAVFDKTGTITNGDPVVTDTIPEPGTNADFLLQLAFSLENKSEHPLAKAINNYAVGKGLPLTSSEDFEVIAGRGLCARIGNAVVYGGNEAFISEIMGEELKAKESAESLEMMGKTPMYFAEDRNGQKTFLGIIAVADTIKPDAAETISMLHGQGIRTIMLTGDNERTARAIAAQAGVDEVIAGVLPDGKEAVIRKLRSEGKVLMVGDGINDAPALTRADVGIAIGAGTDVAIDAADIVLMRNELKDVPAAVRLSRATIRNIHENLFWAFFYNAIGIPLAAGAYIRLFGWAMNPMFGAAAMSLSSFCVVSNALRLNLVKIYDSSKDTVIKSNTTKFFNKEKKKMEKTIVIKGMMCGHCEASVKKALEALDGVEEAVVSHESGTAVVTLSKEVPDESFKAAVEAKDFTFVSVK